MTLNIKKPHLSGFFYIAPNWFPTHCVYAMDQLIIYYQLDGHKNRIIVHIYILLCNFYTTLLFLLYQNRPPIDEMCHLS